MMKKKWLWAAVVASGLLAIAMVAWVAFGRGGSPFGERANPNAYDDFARAAAVPVVLEEQVEELGLEAVVAKNRPAVEAVRAGLEKQFEAPEQYYSVEFDLGTELARFKRLAHVMRMEGKLAEEEGRYADAAAVYLDVIRYGRRVEWGPTISFLTGLAIEALGVAWLEGIAEKLTPEEGKRIAGKLEDLKTERITLAEVYEREEYFVRRIASTPIHFLLRSRNNAMRGFRTTIGTKYERQSESIETLIEILKRER